VVAGLVIVALGAGPERNEPLGTRVVPAQLQAAMANAEMIAASANVGDRFQQLALVDTKLRVICVYHVDFTTGAITLKSVRNFQYDQQMTQFNGKDPLPEDLKALLPSR
jgi:hypothetical protein